MKEELAVKNLREVKEIFDKHGVKFWLESGTLLGAVRNGRIIEWDDDVDLAATDNDFEKIVSTFPELEKRGFDVRLGEISYKNFFGKTLSLYRFGCPMCVDLYQMKGENAVLLSTIPANPISVGFTTLHHLLLYPHPNPSARPSWKPVAKIVNHLFLLLPRLLRKSLANIVWGVGTRSGGIKLAWIVVPKHYFEKFESIKFYGMTFNIPSDVERYLEYKYGRDWRAPKKEWEPYKDDGTFRVLTT